MDTFWKSVLGKDFDFQNNSYHPYLLQSYQFLQDMTQMRLKEAKYKQEFNLTQFSGTMQNLMNKLDFMSLVRHKNTVLWLYDIVQNIVEFRSKTQVNLVLYLIQSLSLYGD
jgi:hypothetical protein